MKNKQELLQKKAALIDKADSILKSAEEAGEFTDEQETEVKELQKQAENIDRLLEARGGIDAAKATVSAPAVIADMHKDGDKDNGGFKSFGEFLHAVAFGDKKGRLNKEQSMGDDSSGGYLVPEQYSTEILQIAAAKTIVRPRATVIPAGNPPDASLTIPVLDYSDNTIGGVEVAWIDEGAEKPGTDAKFDTVSLTPHELAGTITTTDKLLRNYMAAGTLFQNLLGQAIAQAEDMAFLKGDGTGKPLGVLATSANGNTGALGVARNTSGTITYDDILNMLVKAKMDGESYVWVAHQATIPALAKIQDAAGNYIFIMGDATKAIPSMLAGHPIEFTGKTFPLGARGDLALVDFSKYLIKDGSGLYVGASEHALWKQNKTIIKAFTNVDGKPWVKSPIKLEDGATTVSPYVILEA